jgi:hypothetical protein
MTEACEYFCFIRQSFNMYAENKCRRRTELVWIAVFKKAGRTDGWNQAKEEFIFLVENGIRYKEQILLHCDKQKKGKTKHYFPSLDPK